VDPRRSEVNLFMCSPFYKEHHSPEMREENDELFISGGKCIGPVRLLKGADIFHGAYLVALEGGLCSHIKQGRSPDQRSSLASRTRCFGNGRYAGSELVRLRQGFGATAFA